MIGELACQVRPSDPVGMFPFRRHIAVDMIRGTSRVIGVKSREEREKKTTTTRQQTLFASKIFPYLFYAETSVGWMQCRRLYTRKLRLNSVIFPNGTAPLW